MRQYFFSGAKKTTSRGCIMCVLFAGRHLNRILCSLHDLRTSAVKCEERLSLINTFTTGRRLQYGTIIVWNHSLKHTLSNHPLRVRLYLYKKIKQFTSIDQAVDVYRYLRRYVFLTEYRVDHPQSTYSTVVSICRPHMEERDDLMLYRCTLN